MDYLTAELAILTGIVKGMEMRVTKETGGIEIDERDRGRKDECSGKMDEGRRPREGDREEAG